MYKFKGGCSLAKTVWILVAIGAINWGLVGLGAFFGSNWNLVNLLIGSWAMWLENIIYILVGIAGVVSLFHSNCKRCDMPASAPTGAPQMGHM